jgi:hypothetical protein
MFLSLSHNSLLTGIPISHVYSQDSVCKASGLDHHEVSSLCEHIDQTSAHIQPLHNDSKMSFTPSKQIRLLQPSSPHSRHPLAPHRP